MWISNIYTSLVNCFRLLKLGMIFGLGFTVGVVIILLFLVIAWIYIYIKWYG